MVEKYIIFQKNRNEHKNLEGIAPLLRDSKRVYNKIYMNRWANWDTSLWVKIMGHKSEIILDSGVIEELADEIKRIKKSKKLMDKLKRESEF